MTSQDAERRAESLWDPEQWTASQQRSQLMVLCAWSDTHCKREQVCRLWVLGSDDLLQYQPELKGIWGDPDLKQQMCTWDVCPV